MSKNTTNPGKLSDEKALQAAHGVLDGRSDKGLVARLMPFLGPAFIASVAYVDPGNIATNIQSGAKHGYLLLWVIVLSNLMALLIQTLSAKLGIATGLNLAEMCRVRFSKPVVWGMWGVSEIVAMATDLAEFLGAALGFQLLFAMPLWLGAILTAVTTLLILSFERYGFRPLEAVITSLLAIIALCYLVETLLDRPDWAAIAYHAVVPGFNGSDSVILSAGILGATVMPHVIFLHSALTQGRIVTRDHGKLRRLFRFEVADIVIALGVAGLVNAAMLVMGAATFYKAGLSHIATIEDAHLTLKPLLGAASSWVFAVSLLASGLSSSAVGTMSGQVVMKGFLQWKVSIWLRRVITMAPALVVIIYGLDPTATLVFSQVVLSFGIPFALVPLIMFTADPDLMGILVNRRLTTATAWAVAGAIISLNVFLLLQAIWGS